jgi:signal transduction histidine kinase
MPVAHVTTHSPGSLPASGVVVELRDAVKRAAAPAGWRPRWPRASLRNYLVATLLVAAGPLAGLLLWQAADSEQRAQQALQRNLQTLADAMAATVTRERDDVVAQLRRIVAAGTLQAAPAQAAAQLLEAGDTMQHPGTPGVFLLDGDGRMLLDTQPSSVARLSPAARPDWPAHRTALREGRVFVSDVLDPGDPSRRRTEISIDVAGPKGTHYVLGMPISAERWQTLVQSTGAPQGGYVTLFDAQRRVIARSREPERWVGSLMSSRAIAATAGRSWGFIRTDLFGGGPTYYAWQTPAPDGWSIGVGVPAAALDTARDRELWFALGSALACLAAGLAAAMWVARRVTVPLSQLALTGAAGPARPIEVIEIERLRLALAGAATINEATRQRLAKKAEEFETLFQGSPLGLAFAQDRRGAHVIRNPALERIAPFGFGGADEAAHGELLFEGRPMPKERHPLLRAAQRGESVGAMELEIREPGQPPRFVLASAVPLHDVRGEPRGAIGAVTDITELKRAAALLQASDRRQQAARLDAEAANRAKDEFLAMMGHELRNPLNAIATAAQVIARSAPEAPEFARARIIVERQTRKLADTLNALLDAGRVISEDVELQRATVDLAALVGRRAFLAQPKAAMRDTTLHVDTDACAVDGDAARLAEVVDQLLDNAIKFGNGAEIRVALQSLGGEAVLRVGNAGTLAPEVLERAFEPFVQGTRGLDRRHGGFGLGLAVVRRIVHLHGGTVGVSSEADHGTVFEVRLALVDPPDSIFDVGHAPRIASQSVAVIDDNPDALDGLRTMLELDGHRVATSPDGVAGLELLLSHAPDIAIVDIGLPGLDGYQVAQRSRAGGYRGRLIALSGYGQSSDHIRSLAAGFEAHLVKPVDPARLARLLAAV